MIRALEILHEAVALQPVTDADIADLKKTVDQMFHKINLDTVFTKHFSERCNDSRNGKQITVGELVDIFNKTYTKYGQKFKFIPNDTEATIKDANTQINIPIGFVFNPKTKYMELRIITVMRKKNFVTNTPYDKIYNV